MFQVPSFTFWNVAFTAVGVAVFWGKWGRTKLQAYILSDLLNLVPVDDKWRSAIEFLIFLTLGCLVGIGIVQPTTPTQALTAGFGWTGFFTHRSTRG
jgi:hypothetical protein